ncbi:hypothetical protein PoB_001103900 [Plakobranchus ocellatus]|uniref:Uncharacterized protein n=1 Tax=Plakobranchus ocellatus TaxID=259542 RepID=A0AAV3YRC6_9GAST|nr:hypothetical protein PoB_001103900 [Plakobranchus ocellatus]
MLLVRRIHAERQARLGIQTFVITSIQAEGSGGSSDSDRAVGYQVRGLGFESQSGQNQISIAPPCPTSTKWVARSLKTRRK